MFDTGEREREWNKLVQLGRTFHLWREPKWNRLRKQRKEIPNQANPIVGVTIISYYFLLFKIINSYNSLNYKYSLGLKLLHNFTFLILSIVMRPLSFKKTHISFNITRIQKLPLLPAGHWPKQTTRSSQVTMLWERTLFQWWCKVVLIYLQVEYGYGDL